MYHYGSEYAKRYIEGTLQSPYTMYKNETVATVAESLGVGRVWDLGGNVSGLMKMEGSLRFQIERRGIDYGEIDLTPAYFNAGFARSLDKPNDVIYERVDGIVGDMRQMSLATGSCESVVCADVIEHIDNPDQAIAEMGRVLQADGKAIVVVPSLYKLDAVRVPHILHKRFSSHENRLLVSEWVEMLEKQGFVVDKDYSRPLGVASGLLYLTWLNPDYVPVRESEEAVEEFSDQALLFRKAKKVVAKVDREIDARLLDDTKALDNCRAMFQQGDILGILRMIKKWYEQVAIPHVDVTNLVESFDVGSVSLEAMEQLRRVVTASDDTIQDNSFFGNSALLVMGKK